MASTRAFNVSRLDSNEAVLSIMDIRYTQSTPQQLMVETNFFFLEVKGWIQGALPENC
jgi:hypothetical protein